MRIGQDTLALQGAEISKTAVDMGTAFELDPIWLGHAAHFSIQLEFTGTPSGTWKLQGSADKGTSTRGEGFYDLNNTLQTWTDLDCSEQAIAEAGDHMWTGTNIGYRWVRVVWTPTGGSGSLTKAQFSTKGH